jgi:hypothetical protein
VSAWFKNESAKMCVRCVGCKFLGVIIHEHGIKIDPIKIESIYKV